MRPRVIIVGAGPGGLASAMLLASGGCAVTVLERQPRVGGRTSTLKLSDPASPPSSQPFRFDLGPTFFLYPRVLEEIFAACGKCLADEVELIRLDPQYHLIFEQGGQMRATGDVPRMQEQIAALAPADAARFPAFLADNREKLAAFRPILESPFARRRDLLAPAVVRSLPKLRPLASVNSDLRRYFHDERVRLAFSFQSKYLGMSPFRCPSLFTILSFLEYEYGVWHPVGGCGAVTDAMAQVCREMGVEIRLDEEVTALQFAGRRVTAVQTQRARYEADSVVLNADFAHAAQRLVPSHLRRHWSDARIAKAKFSCSTFMMYLGIEGRCDQLEHHTIWLAKDYLKGLDEIERLHVPCENPSFYVANPCRTDPALAPPGCSALYCLAPVTHNRGGIDWAAETPRYRALMFRQLAKLGLSDLENRVRCEKILTPQQWEHEHHIHRGATFNLSHSLGQLLHRRPHNRYQDLQNVYLVGGGTHPGSGLPVIFESARISSRLLLQDQKMKVPWRGQTGEPARWCEPAAVDAALEAVGT
jgi:phytoene desaturase